MTTCFVKWDNSYSYKLADPNNNFSIINVQGVPQKIIWDGGGSGKEHIINNPSNYSYSIVNSNSNFSYYFEFSNWFTGGVEYLNGSIYYQSFNYSKLLFLNSFQYQPPQWYADKNIIFSAFGLDYNYWHLSCEMKDINNNNNYYIIIARTFWGANFSINTFTLKNLTINFEYYKAQLNNAGRGAIFNPPQSLNLIRISDNNIIYYYPITNTNSIQIIYNSGGNKIEIEGKQFDITDVNSAYKDCDKHCPQGLIECQCGNQLCCYKKTNSGYKLVTSIKI